MRTLLGKTLDELKEIALELSLPAFTAKQIDTTQYPMFTKADLRALKENTFYAYLYSNNKCIGKYKMAVYFNRAVNEITENNRSSFKNISFRVKLTQKRMKELNKNAKYIDCFKITMFNDIYYKGVFKTLNFEKEYFCIKKEIVLKYCIEIDKF